MKLLGVLALVGSAGILQASSLDSLFDPAPIRAKYQYLYSEKLQSMPDGSLKFHQARLFKRDGFNILHLKGDIFETAFQHGALLREEIRDGAIIQSSRMIYNTVRNALGSDGPFTNIIYGFIDRFLTDRILKYAVEAHPKVLESLSHSALAISDTTGIPVNQLADAALAPDTLMLLAAMSMKFGSFPSNAEQFAGNCTAFTAWDNFTRSGELIVGRNLDFPLTAFDKHPALIYVEPTDGGQKFLSVVSAGIQFFGITGINASGIYLSLHTLPTPETSAKGMPLFLTGTAILREAKSFDQAVDFLKKNPPPTGWTYDLISTRERRVGSVEMTNQRVSVRESFGGYHVQANHFLAPDMRDRMLFVNRSVDEDTLARYNRAETLILKHRGQFDKATAANILGDQVDPFSGKVRGVGNTVAVHTTVTSIVLVPNEDRIYVATGRAPVSHHRFVSFPLPGSFDADGFLDTPVAEIEGSGFDVKHPHMAKAQQFFIRAKEAYEYRNDVKEALEYMNQVVDWDQTNPHYYFVQGILALKAGETEQGKVAFSRLLLNEPSQHQAHLAHFYLGKIFADSYDVPNAQREFALLLDDPNTDAKLRSAARRASLAVQIFGHKALRPAKLSLMFQQGDMEHY